jgi:hypothetical protein
LIYTTGVNYLPWWRHLAAYLKMWDRLHHTLFITEDIEECLPLWEVNIKCLQLHGKVTRLLVDTTIFPRAVTAKHFYMLKFLEAGFDALFTDADVAFLGDPLGLFGRGLQVLSDYLEPPHLKCYNHKSGTCASTGLMVATPSDAPLWRKVVATLVATPQMWEQEVFNRALSPTFNHYFDIQTATNCRVSRYYGATLGVPPTVVALHLGWVERELKRLMFEKLGLYLGNTPWDAPPQVVELQFNTTVCRPDGIWSLP